MVGVERFEIIYVIEFQRLFRPLCKLVMLALLSEAISVLHQFALWINPYLRLCASFLPGCRDYNVAA